MTIAAGQKYWTDEELLALPKEGGDSEVIDGELVVCPANAQHGRSIVRLMLAIGAFVEEHHLGEVLDGQTGVRMKEGSLLSPDISYVTKAAWAEYEASGATFLMRSPELVVEVLSAWDTVDRIERKLELYFENGTKLAWMVRPRTKSVHVHRGVIAERVLTGREVLDGGEVLPGFLFEIGRLF